jgi:hypothetical protein
MGVLFHNQVREESPTIRELSCRKNAWGGHHRGAPSDVLELVISSYRAKNSQLRLVTQDSLSLICSTGFVNFWTGMPFASS